MSPQISPNKTWEGAVASVIGSALLGVYCLRHLQGLNEGLRSIHLMAAPAGLMALWHEVFTPPPLWWAIAASIIINIAAQLGDLAESMLKRGAGVKDSGALLPGHGGALDRVDALLFAAPVAMLIFSFSPIHP